METATLRRELGLPPRAKSCAICAAAITLRLPAVERPLGRGDALVPICLGCDEEPARTKDGPHLGFVPSGGMLNPKDAETGARHLMGDEYDRQVAIAQAYSLATTAPVPEAEANMRAMQLETARRNKTRASDSRNHRSSRSRKLY